MYVCVCVCVYIGECKASLLTPTTLFSSAFKRFALFSFPFLIKITRRLRRTCQFSKRRGSCRF